MGCSLSRNLFNMAGRFSIVKEYEAKSEFESREGQDFCPIHVVQAGCGAHPASYLMGTRESFSGGKATGAWSWSLTSN
jgi:hypothetical protein